LTTKKSLILVLSVSLSILCLWYVLKDISFAAVLQELKRVSIPSIVAFCLSIFLQILLRAIRWEYLLPAPTSLKARFRATWLGNSANLVLPLRAGEIIRPTILAKEEKLDVLSVLSSLVPERALDIITLGIFLTGTISFIATVPEAVSKGALTLTALAILGLVLFPFIRSRRLLVYISSKIPKESLSKFVLEKGSSVLDGIEPVYQKRKILPIIFLSIAVWLASSLGYWVVLRGFSVDLPITAGIFLTAVLAFSVALPSAPGFIGVFQLGCSIALCGGFGLSEEFALAYSLIVHILQIILAVAVSPFLIQRK
jgi:glycosyltransferase 2 family protein